MVARKRPQSYSPDNLTVDSSQTLPLHKQHDSERSSSGSPPSYRRTQRYHSGGSHNDEDVLPRWSANPQAPGDNDANGDGHHTPVHSNSGSYFSTTQQYNRRHWLFSCQVLVLAVAFLAVIVAVMHSRGSLVYSLEEVAQLVHNNNLLKSKMNNAEKGIKLLQREVSALDAMRQQHAPNGDDNNSLSSSTNQALEEMRQLSDHLKESQKRADSLKLKVQQLSKQEASAKYGDHVHRVEIELAFPDGREGPTRFVIELAPVELMPHSVHFFLEMVSSQLLDGCSFILNALHVLKAAPLPYDGSSAASKARAFTRLGLESVAFKEYAPSYPHEQYTVGFAADGSPSFYINTEDNSEIHLGDPCFGKIVEGFDTVKRLEASPTRNGIWFEQRIGIKKATVLM